MINKGTLFLIPNVIAEDTQAQVIPEQVKEVLINIRKFAVEDVRTARRYLSSLRMYPSIEALDFSVLNKDTDPADIENVLAPLRNGENVGVISDSGCPGVADPGALAVNYAHRHGFEVIPLVGPSSLLLALMGSGLNGQKFAFHGYLPIDSKELSKSIKALEDESRKANQTQIVIETPYRNNQMLKSLVSTLGIQTQLTVAVDLTGKDQAIRTKTVKEWRSKSLELPKKPAVFLFLA